MAPTLSLVDWPTKRGSRESLLSHDRARSAKKGSKTLYFAPNDRQPYIKLLPVIPSNVSILIPPTQLEHTLRYFGVYAEAIDKLYTLVPSIPRLGESSFLREPPICLHYYNDTINYFIYEYDGKDTMQGLVRFTLFPEENGYRKFSLTEIKKITTMQLDFSWEVQR